MSTLDFARLLGYEVTHVTMSETSESWKDLQALAEAYKQNGHVLPEPEAIEDPAVGEQARRVHAIIDSIKAGIRRGLPVVAWHAFTNAEYDVITGYDDRTGEFLGWGSHSNPDDGTYARAPQGRMVETAFFGGLPNALLLSGPVGELDARQAEIAALREAVSHGRSQENVDKVGGDEWCMLQGIACYDRWSSDWSDPDKKREVGDAYCIGIYSDTHGAAAPFLREIAPRHGQARRDLERAADSFEAESAVLARCRELIWWSAPEGPDPGRNQEAAALLAEARDHYASGIAALEDALEHFE
jgi:hypothetical protein